MRRTVPCSPVSPSRPPGGVAASSTRPPIRPQRRHPRGGAAGAGSVCISSGWLAADVFLTRVSFVVVVTGAVWFLAGGRAVRAVAAPLAFLLIAIPLPELLVNAITLPLQLVASRVGEATLALAGVPVFAMAHAGVAVDHASSRRACSGCARSCRWAAIGLLLAWSEPSWPRRAAIVVSVCRSRSYERIPNCATGVTCEAWSPRAASVRGTRSAAG